MTGPDDAGGSRVPGSLSRLVREFSALDEAVSAAVAATPTPTVDALLGRLSNAANNSRLWIGTAALVGLLGRDERRAALTGLAALGLTSATVNLAIKPVLSRDRPLREVEEHRVTMPRSTSFPSGHSASAFAFSTALGGELPAIAAPLRVMATGVAYSRVQTGVHYVGDVVVGALIGASIGTVVRQVADHLPSRRGG
jgi:undecaprenyl-diphosphatase